MAVSQYLFTTLQGIQIKANMPYTADNVPTDADIIHICRGVKIMDENGNPTGLRGLRVLVENTGVTAPVTPVENVPVIWLQDENRAFLPTATYTFLDDGIIEVGKLVEV